MPDREGEAPENFCKSSELSRAELAKVVASVGLELLGVVRLGPEPSFPQFAAWLAAGKQAGMAYLAEHLACRKDPSQVFPGSQSALILGLPYYLGDRYDRGEAFGPPRIAQYARLRDYHKVLRRRGERLLSELLASRGEAAAAGRLLVDTAPVLERALASRTARGFIGKNTLYIHPTWGSYLMLAELLLSWPLVYDEPAQVEPTQRSAEGGCGSCRRCQVHCPTGALADDYVLDARRCLSYYTIEHRGVIPIEFWPHLRYYLFGCDICQLVCPYNRRVEPIGVSDLRRLGLPSLVELATMDQAGYERLAGGSPLTRAKKTGLQRNALIAMVVTDDPELQAVEVELGKAGEALLLATLAQIPAYRAYAGGRGPNELA